MHLLMSVCVSDQAVVCQGHVKVMVWMVRCAQHKCGLPVMSVFSEYFQSCLSLMSLLLIAPSVRYL